MNKRIRIIIWIIFLLLGAAFIGLCWFGISNQTEESLIKSTAQKVEPPFSNISQGKSIPGTWEYQSGNKKIIVAFNSDETCEFYLEIQDDSLLEGVFKTLVPGTFINTDKDIEINLSTPIGENFELDQYQYTFKYVLDKDTLTLEDQKESYIFKRIS